MFEVNTLSLIFRPAFSDENNAESLERGALYRDLGSRSISLIVHILMRVIPNTTLLTKSP